MTPVFCQRKSFVSDTGCLQEIMDFIRSCAVKSSFTSRETIALILAVEEACTNVIKHTYHYNPNHNLTLTWMDKGDFVVIELEDDSSDPYLPALPDFDLQSKIHYRHYSGYGIHLLQKAVDDLQYETIPGSHNKVTLVKFHEGKAPKKVRTQDPYALVRSRSASLAAIFEISNLFSRGTNLAEICTQTLYSIVGRLAAQPVVLMAPQNVEGHFRIVGQTGLSSKIDKTKLFFPKSGWVFETLAAHRGPFLASRFESMQIPDVELDVLEQIRSQVLIPIIMMNRLKGILSLGKKRTGRPFTEDDMNFVTHLASFLLLLLRNRSEKTAEGSLSAEAPMGSDLRACCRVAISKVVEISKASGLSLQFKEPDQAVRVLIDQEILQKVLITLLMHGLFATESGQSLQLSIDVAAEQASLILAYQGIPLSFERGRNGYNTLVDKMLTSSARLSEVPKMISGCQGKIQIQKSEGENNDDPSAVRLILELPLVQTAS